SRSVWFDVVGRHCPAFAVNREVLMPIPKPTGFTGADPYKITFQIGHEKFHVPWLYVINRKTSEVPLIDFHLKYSGNDILGVTAKVVDMPHHYVEVHPDIKKNFWDPQNWPKYVLVRYTWEEQSEIDVTGGFYVFSLAFGIGAYRIPWTSDQTIYVILITIAFTHAGLICIQHLPAQIISYVKLLKDKELDSLQRTSSFLTLVVYLILFA
ncbi:hypothetical protein ACJX0J_028722, partial [Zea mays]